MAKNIEEPVEDIVILGDEAEKQTDVAKCPSCGANMVFSPENQLLKCEHCGSEIAFNTQRNEEQDFNKLFEKVTPWSDETHVFCCNNCGAKTVISKTEIASNCSFCGTSNIVETSELSGLKPNAVVPFKITKDTAIQKAVAWVKKKFFAPKKFKKNIEANDVSGMYNPAFTFDANTLSVYKGRLGRYKYVTKRVNGKTVTQRKTEYFTISGTYSMFFDDILVQASSAIPQKTVDKLQPFQTNDSKAYAKEFLHGYTATQYTKDGKVCWGEAKRLMDRRIRSGILSKYTYNVVDYLNISTDCSNVTYKYLLLPVYVGHFNWRKKIYNFFVNGYNGKLAGKTPVSAGKVSLVAGIALALLGGIAAAVLLLGG